MFKVHCTLQRCFDVITKKVACLVVIQDTLTGQSLTVTLTEMCSLSWFCVAYSTCVQYHYCNISCLGQASGEKLAHIK